MVIVACMSCCAVKVGRSTPKVNAKRVYRLYKLEGLSLRLQQRKKRVSHLRVVQPQAQHPNERWSLDFMSDTLSCGRRMRVLTAVDHFSRVSPLVEVGVWLSGHRVVEALERGGSGTSLPGLWLPQDRLCG